MSRYLLAVLAISFLSLVAACAKSKPATATPAGTGAMGAPAERRWTYAAEITTGEGEQSHHDITLVERARRDVGATRLIELAVLIDGVAADEDTLAAFASAPFTTFGASVTLLVGTHAGERAVWLAFGDAAPLTNAAVVETVESPPLWTLTAAARAPLGNDEISDEPFHYGKQIGGRDSYCTGFLHPSPDSGDYFSWEQCFAPETGITRLVFESVWGGYTLELKEAPAGFSL